ncbi:MAG TPA: Fic family protein [Blastocatellia bacterium]|nr:Fic family protein [Blastocatellia bacterium]
MQRPPGRNLPPILSSRPSYEWINSINRKLEELNSVQPSRDSRIEFAPWMESDFVFSALTLAGARVERARVEEAVRSARAPGDGPEDVSIIRLLRALRSVASRVESEGRKAGLTPEFLLSFARKPDGSGGEFRKARADQLKGAGSAPRLAAPPEYLPAMVESACLWFTAGSFEEMHPLEQAAIVHLRLIEIRPFEEGNEELSLVAASLFTLRGGLPPVIIPQEMTNAYRDAVDEGFRMNTRPMVELMARAAEKTLSEMIEIAARG